jgi:hypothetical protein
MSNPPAATLRLGRVSARLPQRDLLAAVLVRWIFAGTITVVAA